MLQQQVQRNVEGYQAILYLHPTRYNTSHETHCISAQGRRVILHHATPEGNLAAETCHPPLYLQSTTHSPILQPCSSAQEARQRQQCKSTPKYKTRRLIRPSSYSLPSSAHIYTHSPRERILHLLLLALFFTRDFRLFIHLPPYNLALGISR
jgi:hypothetical protein